MRCENCRDVIEDGEERELHGRALCEDCYMDALSPPRACDPWAVHSAKSFMKETIKDTELTPTQSRILEVLRETKGVEPKFLAETLQLKPSDLEREIATLRHMERIRGELRDGKRIIRLW